MNSKSIKVDMEVYKILIKIASNLQRIKEKKISLNEALKFAINNPKLARSFR